MTRDELIESVVRSILDAERRSLGLPHRVFHTPADRESVAPMAQGAIDTIFAALKEPTEAMVLAAGETWGITVTSNEYENMEDEWRLMLATSPLAPEGGKN